MDGVPDSSASTATTVPDPEELKKTQEIAKHHKRQTMMGLGIIILILLAGLFASMYMFRHTMMQQIPNQHPVLQHISK